MKDRLTVRSLSRNKNHYSLRKETDMNKKTMIVYTFLFLFAFTFGLSFTLAQAQQPVVECCVMSWCPNDPDQPGRTGHWVFGSAGYWVCCDTKTGHPCDIWLQCAY